MFSLCLKAGFWGFFGGSALLLGLVTCYYNQIPQRSIAAIVVFGAEVLISALLFESIESEQSVLVQLTAN
jgi:zinc transporter, ZIP family